MMEQLNDLVRLAMRATPEEWTTNDRGGVIAVDDQANGGYVICATSGRDKFYNAEFIAAADPKTILAIAEAFQSLEKQRDVLAAENAALKSAFLPENLPEEAVDAVNGTAQFDWDFNDCGSWTWVVNDDDVAKAVIGAITPLQTPATDAYLNSVRAEGVEMLSETLPAYAYYQAEADIKAFAAQLRAGEPS